MAPLRRSYGIVIQYGSAYLTSDILQVVQEAGKDHRRV